MKRKIQKPKTGKRKGTPIIVNNGEIVYPYKEALMKGLSKNQFRDAIDDLIEKGFLEITYQGTGQGDPNTYKLCERWKAYGTQNFNPANPRRKNTSPDHGWAKYNREKKQKSSVKKHTKTSVKTPTKKNEGIDYRVSELTPRNETYYAASN